MCVHTGVDQRPPAPTPQLPKTGPQERPTSEQTAEVEVQQLPDAVIKTAPPPLTVGSAHKYTVPGQGEPTSGAPQQTPQGSDDVSQEPEPPRASIESMAPMVAEQAKRLNEVCCQLMAGNVF